jgi:NAD(P)-dependent dehydrogenase (short-subunit alcohol dehydrogenase family)
VTLRPWCLITEAFIHTPNRYCEVGNRNGWAEAALQRGDRVTATARKLADVADLTERFGDAVLPLALDVTDSAQVQQAIHEAYAHFGRLDVVVNNAGASLFAATEEASDEQIPGVFDANYLGMVRVLRAALPLLRKQGSGHILGVSSGLGIAALPMIGFYSATKWAVEALHEALAQEVKAFGLKVTIVEPGAYATDFGKSSQIADALEPYAEFRKQFLTHLANVERGDPEATDRSHLQACGRGKSAVATWPGHFYPAQGPRRVCGAAEDMGSVGGRF